ncbi:MAG: AMP-binding protein, partial [Hyphomicrobium sp.]
MNKPIWTPARERVASSNLTRFVDFIGPRQGQMDDDALHRWSVTHSADFWSELWDFAGVIGGKGALPWLIDADQMPGAKFFPAATLNYAENVLRHAGGQQEVVFWGEDRVKARVLGPDLIDAAGRFQRFLTSSGVVAGDRIAAIMPNMPEAMIAMLGAASTGAVWSSCSPDFGEQGILDRFGQIAPKVLVVCDGYYYAGKTLDITDKVIAILAKLPGIERVVVVDYLGHAKDAATRINRAGGTGRASVWSDVQAEAGPGAPAYVRLPFSHPLYILYTSGTTGVPKCIVHSAGGLLLK